jgi:DNA-binding CsgD family transcriptional regulator
MGSEQTSVVNEGRAQFEVAGETLRGVNGPLARLLGVEASAMVGGSARAWFSGLPSGESTATGNLTVAALGADGPWKLEVAVRRQGELMQVEVLTAEPVTTDEAGAFTERDYTVALQEPFGRLISMDVMGAHLGSARFEGRRCFEVFQRRLSPCESCPLLQQAATQGLPPPKARAKGVGESVCVTTVVQQGNTARVSNRVTSEAALPALATARQERLATAHKLSGRERELLTHLAQGHSVREVATALGITERTAKFHQANLFHKLRVAGRGALVAKLLGGA